MASSSSISVICVNDQDQEIAHCEKLEAHKLGMLHRATSVFITTPPLSDKEVKVLLQQRCFSKYHSPGQWSNGACTHPLAGETPEESAARSLNTELGLDQINLDYKGYFIYRAVVKNAQGEDLIEHELDHVFIAHLDDCILIPFSPEEVHQVRWITQSELDKELKEAPESFSHWFNYLYEFIKNPVSGKDFRR